MADGEDIIGRAIRKLDHLADLDEADHQALRSLKTKIRSIGANQILVSQGSDVAKCFVLVNGYACSHRETSGGGRQILSFRLPGDILNLDRLLMKRADHNVQTISSATVAEIGLESLRQIVGQRPRIAEALWRAMLIDASIAREWVLNVGRRTATQRIAHLLCEFATLRDAAGLGHPDRFELPMTQEQIGDATGLTAVHVNRKLHDLEKAGVIARTRREWTIVDWRRLKRIGDFDDHYLCAA